MYFHDILVSFKADYQPIDHPMQLDKRQKYVEHRQERGPTAIGKLVLMHCSAVLLPVAGGKAERDERGTCSAVPPPVAGGKSERDERGESHERGPLCVE